MSNKTFTPYSMTVDVDTFTLALSIIAQHNHGAQIPVDPYLLAILVDKNNQAIDVIYWDNPESSGLMHLEDERVCTDAGEEISVNTTKIPPEVQGIIFLLTTESSLSPGHTLSSLQCLSPLYCTSKFHQEIGIYRQHEMRESTNLQVAEMTRQADANWLLAFQPVPLEGSLNELLAQFGIDASEE